MTTELVTLRMAVSSSSKGLLVVGTDGWSLPAYVLGFAVAKLVLWLLLLPMLRILGSSGLSGPSTPDYMPKK